MAGAEDMVAKKKAEEQAAAAAAASESKEPEFAISGLLGGPFNIDGDGFGFEGSVTIGDRVIQTSRWVDRSIKGSLPADLKPGKVTVRLNDGKILTGVWPAAKKTAVSSSSNPAQRINDPTLGGSQAVNLPEEQAKPATVK